MGRAANTVHAGKIISVLYKNCHSCGRLCKTNITGHGCLYFLPQFEKNANPGNIYSITNFYFVLDTTGTIIPTHASCIFHITNISLIFPLTVLL